MQNRGSQCTLVDEARPISFFFFLFGLGFLFYSTVTSARDFVSKKKQKAEERVALLFNTNFKELLTMLVTLIEG